LTTVVVLFHLPKNAGHRQDHSYPGDLKAKQRKHSEDRAVSCGWQTHFYQKKTAYTVWMNAAFANVNISVAKTIND